MAKTKSNKSTKLATSTARKPKPLSPLRLGNKVLIRTVTYFQVGKIVGIDALEVLLEDASWICDTGRFNDALRTGVFSEVEPFVGIASVGRGAIVDVATFDHELPRSVK